MVRMLPCRWYTSGRGWYDNVIVGVRASHEARSALRNVLNLMLTAAGLDTYVRS